MNSPTKCWLVFGALALVVATAALAAGGGCGEDETADTGVGGECCDVYDGCKGKSELDQCEMWYGGETGYCVPSPDPTWMECVPGCPRPEVGQLCEHGCCYIAGNENEFPCGPLGTKLAGETCSAVNDCVCGAVCLERNGGALCWVVCTYGHECEMGSCTDTGLGFSVCAEEESE